LRFCVWEETMLGGTPGCWSVLNDPIIRTAARLRLEVLELRSVCTDSEDIVLQVEPSARGAPEGSRTPSRRWRGGAPAAGIHWERE
jgi:hypothetical protein